MTPQEFREHNRLNARASAGRDPFKSEPAFYSQGAELDSLEQRADLTPIEAARREYLRVERRHGAIALPGERWGPDALAADIACAERRFLAAAE